MSGQFLMLMGDTRNVKEAGGVELCAVHRQAARSATLMNTMKTYPPRVSGVDRLIYSLPPRSSFLYSNVAPHLHIRVAVGRILNKNVELAKIWQLFRLLIIFSQLNNLYIYNGSLANLSIIAGTRDFAYVK